MNIALCYKGAFKINQIKNVGLDPNYIKEYEEALLNHRLMLWDKFGEDKPHLFCSTYFIDDNFHQLLNKNFVKYFNSFENISNIAQNTWNAQLNHYIKIIDLIKNEESKGLNYDFFIFTRPDIKFMVSYDKQKIDINKFNITVKHASGNSDDNYWLFPKKYFKAFEKSIIQMSQKNKITHEINHYLEYNNVSINYIDNLIESYMGHTIFSFIR